MRPLASRMSRLGTETAFEVLAKARALEAKGRAIVHLEIGEPDFDTPPAIVAAGVAALERGETHYPPSAGVVELREAIARYLSDRRGVRADPDQVIVTPGAKPIMFYALLALLDQGDEAIYPDPGFPIYSSMINFAGARGVPLALREENDFQPDLDELRRLVTNSVSCTATFVQRAGTAALSSRPPEVDKMLAEFRRRRDAVVMGLNAVPGITCRVPHGAFYVFPNVRGLGLRSSTEVADRLLTEAGVATLTGTCFGAAGEGYLRLSYANSLANLDKAVSRIADWSSRLAPLSTAR